MPQILPHSELGGIEEEVDQGVASACTRPQLIWSSCIFRFLGLSSRHERVDSQGTLSA